VTTNFIPFALPNIGEEEINEVIDTLRSGWLTTGPKTRLFEQQFAAFIGVKHALAVNSGTAALHLGLEAVGVRVGDKVVTTPYTFTASAEVIRYLGADPVFVDIDPKTFNIDVNQLANVLESTTGIKAVIPVHIAGQSCEMDTILNLAKKYNLKVVEDAAHALPTYYKNKLIGTLSDMTAYSFYATKPLATGEGGMLVTNNDDEAERIKIMRLHGINRDVFKRESTLQPSWYYEVVAPGYKYNMSDIMSALGIQQLRKVEQSLHQRTEIAARYNTELSNLPLQRPHRDDNSSHAWHLYIIQLNLSELTINRDQFIETLKQRGVGASVHFIPLHIQPYWRERYGFRPEDFPYALETYQRSVSLPIYPTLTEKEISYIISTIRDICYEAAR
jgi:dTDP-4-amino-4,6-dideoxygalactose transaminase